MTVKNNFERYKSDFKSDAKLNADENIELYIQYHNARSSDYNMQLITYLIDRIDLIERKINPIK